MRILITILVSLMTFNVFAKDTFSKELAKCSGLFKEARYQATSECLNGAKKLVNEKNYDEVGQLAYFEAITYARLQIYSQAIPAFVKAIKHNYDAEDLFYEYGQASYAAGKNEKARAAFKVSLKKGYKKAVSLYYIAFITQELGDHKKAVNLYRALERVNDSEKKEVIQPARMLIGDIYLENSEKHPDAFKTVQYYVIPQYERALNYDKESELAKEIKEKILAIQKKYELLLFQFRNGRPTRIPPYFLRISYDISNDSNVTYTPEETTTSESDQSSLVSKVDTIGRYSFFYKDYFRVSPELRFNRTYHHNRTESIYQNDNYLINAAVRNSYEHKLFNKPASLLFDIDYSYVERDINAQKELVFASRSYTFMIGERLNLFEGGESVFRLKKRNFFSYNSASNASTTSLTYEQLKVLKGGYGLIIFASYDRTRNNTQTFNTNSMMGRLDVLLPSYKDYFSPSVGLSYKMIDPVNNKEARGSETLVNPSFRLTKSFAKRYRASFHFDYEKYDSKDKQNFAYKKTIYGIELEYLF